MKRKIHENEREDSSDRKNETTDIKDRKRGNGNEDTHKKKIIM
jgi:hypothetical protein